VDQESFELKDKVKEAILKQLQMSGEGIIIDIRGHEVKLSGVVDVLAEKVAAEEVVRGITGVQSIDNSLTIGMDNPVDDREIKALVEERVASEPRLELRRIGVRVHDGVIHLIGEVDSLADKELAIALCQQVRGVKEVVSQLASPRKGEVDDASVINAVELAFSRTLVVDPKNIRTSCRNGLVTLEGFVQSPEEAVAALRVASLVKGVRDIINRIETGHGKSSENARLTNELRRRLNSHHLVSPAQVRAFVVGNWAFLAGEVYSFDAKGAAEEVAYNLKGISGVANDIEVAVH